MLSGTPRAGHWQKRLVWGQGPSVTIQPCIPGLIIIQSTAFKILMLTKSIEDYKFIFLFFKLLLKFFFCFAFAGKANIDENEIFVSMNHSVNLQYA